MNWIQTYSLSIASGWLLGIRDVGLLAALVNFVLPISHIGMASLRLLMPRLAGLRARRGTKALQQVVRRLSMIFCGGAATYWILLWSFGGPLFQRIYGEKFGHYGSLVPWATAYIVIWSATFPFQMGLRALFAFDGEFRVLSVVAVTILAIGIPAMKWAGLSGVFAATIAANLLGFVTAIILFQRRLSRESGGC